MGTGRTKRAHEGERGRGARKIMGGSDKQGEGKGRKRGERANKIGKGRENHIHKDCETNIYKK